MKTGFYIYFYPPSFVPSWGNLDPITCLLSSCSDLGLVKHVNLQSATQSESFSSRESSPRVWHRSLTHSCSLGGEEPSAHKPTALFSPRWPLVTAKDHQCYTGWTQPENHHSRQQWQPHSRAKGGAFYRTMKMDSSCRESVCSRRQGSVVWALRGLEPREASVLPQVHSYLFLQIY